MTDSHDGPSVKATPSDGHDKSSSAKIVPMGEAKIDEFGLPTHSKVTRTNGSVQESDDESDAFHDAEDTTVNQRPPVDKVKQADVGNVVEEEKLASKTAEVNAEPTAIKDETKPEQLESKPEPTTVRAHPSEDDSKSETRSVKDGDGDDKSGGKAAQSRRRTRGMSAASAGSASFPAIMKEKRTSDVPNVSEWSHQQLAPSKDDSDEEEEVEWQAMPAIDEYDVFDDDGRLIAKGTKLEQENVTSPYLNMAGAGKGYTRVLDDEDARSTTSMDDETNYLFQKPKQMSEETKGEYDDDDDEDDQRDALSQLEATKDLLTEGQRIAYVGVVRLIMFTMLKAMQNMEPTRSTKKDLLKAVDSMEMWGQQMMVRLYKHMDISTAEQLMIEQLAEHGLEAQDLAPPLMQNAKVKNPMAEEKEKSSPENPSSSRTSLSQASTAADSTLKEVKEGEEVPEVHGPEEMPQTNQIDLDIRWTVLCDLFLVLLADSVYDSRSRRLLERVGSVMKINWIQICRFEKRVIDSLEMQEGAKENWDESEHMEVRRKRGLKKKYMVMGLATVGGGLVIGLSAGLLAPVIGAGLAAGFTTIGVTGTAGFLGGVGGAAIITTAATAAGGGIAIKASHRRTGHVKTFEYRPLHNNKRLNLILTVSGWMTGKVDDVRLPFSTVDPIMGDIYSLLWEPEMLRSMGDTINILATEALTQTVQQVLGSTILVALMASLQLPVVLTKLAYLIDNPWTVSLDRANAAGLILADSLIARHLGQRPITLLGFSLGARLIFSCLKELAARGAYGIIQNVYLFGSPVVAKKDEWLKARSVIAGRFVNGYATNDWILGYLFRATSGGISRVAGLASVDDIPGLENLDVTELVNGHMAYRSAMPKLLRKVGWEVESDEFTEIEDPDPEDHAKRQRELIREIDEARKQAEKQPAKKRFGLFKRGQLAEKKGWETYDASAQKTPSPITPVGTESNPFGDTILFDIDAIRKELISEQIEVRELESTQPPMQFTSVKNGEKHVEYLRLPPGIEPEEMSKLSLPPRPHELEEGPLPTPAKNGVQRTSSVPPTKITSDIEDHDISLEQPRELKSTLPPLKLTTAATGSNESLHNVAAAAPHVRPGLKKSDTAPVGLGLSTPSYSRPSTNFAAPELEENAWDQDEFGQSKGNIKMTFE